MHPGLSAFLHQRNTTQSHSSNRLIPVQYKCCSYSQCICISEMGRLLKWGHNVFCKRGNWSWDWQLCCLTSSTVAPVSPRVGSCPLMSPQAFSKMWGRPPKTWWLLQIDILACFKRKQLIRSICRQRHSTHSWTWFSVSRPFNTLKGYSI